MRRRSGTRTIGCRSVSVVERGADVHTGEHREDVGLQEADQHLERRDEHEHEEPEHTEFEGRYQFSCEAPDALNDINFVYFDKFANAQEVEVQVVARNGSLGAEVTREAPLLELNGLK